MLVCMPARMVVVRYQWECPSGQDVLAIIVVVFRASKNECQSVQSPPNRLIASRVLHSGGITVLGDVQMDVFHQ